MEWQLQEVLEEVRPLPRVQGKFSGKRLMNIIMIIFMDNGHDNFIHTGFSFNWPLLKSKSI